MRSDRSVAPTCARGPPWESGAPALRLANLPLAEQRREHARVVWHAARHRLDEHARRAWVHGEPRHLLARRRDRALGVERAHRREELGRRAQRLRGRRLEPRDARDVRRGEIEHRLREVGAVNLRDVVLGARVEVRLQVEAQASPRARPSGASGALRRRRAADFLDAERGQPRPRRVGRDAREAAVDDRDDPVDRDRRLRDVRRQDDLVLVGAADGAVLLGTGGRSP